MLGYQLALAPWHTSQTEAPVVEECFRRAEETWNAAHTRLQRAARWHKEQADRHPSEPPVFSPSNRVWLSTRNLPFHLPCRKLSPRPVVPGTLAEAGSNDALPPPLDIEGGPAYSVREVLDSRCQAGCLQYLIDWEVYGPEERCWVPVVDILDALPTRDFHRWCPDRPVSLWSSPRPVSSRCTSTAAVPVSSQCSVIPFTSSGGLRHRPSRHH
ncbi:uncharacterized protein [Salvelinus sp. IW2-2015]|uniref:uncharacterized protein n=1 Tax=Salvelinus sp. IW2-2015 TaxID=2691554 RepID=UPI000CDF6FF6|nr:uncharacterized protein LOC111973491 [Salvelinus alpinus]